MSVASRRGLLGGLAALVPIATQGMPVVGIPGRLGVAVTATPLPDAALLACCEAFHETNAGYYATDEDDAAGVLFDRRCDISDQIESMTPLTNAGSLAKARVALVLFEECADEGNAYERFALVTLRQIAWGAA